MIIVVPEDLLDKAKDLTPEYVCAIKHLIEPSVITSGDLKMAMEVLEKLRAALSRMMEVNPNVGDTSPYLLPHNTYTVTPKINPRGFIRYVRPTDVYDRPLSFGGFAVYVELYPAEGFFRFSLSLCGRKDLFNKKIAALICTNRFNGGHYFEVSNYDQSISVMANIYAAVKKYLHEEDYAGILDRPVLVTLPLKTKLSTLKKVVELIDGYYSPVDMGSLLEIVKGK